MKNDFATGQVRVRFAPSPTGFLHIGGARTTLYNWLFARRHGGTFVLRIEDTDELRSTPESVGAILESIRWLALDWDEGPEKGGPFAPYFQMQRAEQGIYKKHADQLLAEGKAYPCWCTKGELDAMRQAASAAKRPVLYDRRCRRLTAAQRAERAGRPFCVRFKLPEDGATVVPDRVRGEVSFENALLQDLVIQKVSGGPTYNFACVVDDHLMEITHVIRGDEHLANTPLQLRMYEALGFKPPEFAHLSMILGTDGAKLSKRHGATSTLEYREQGYLPQTLRNALALLGWSTSDAQQLFQPGELERKFDLAGCQKNPAKFDAEKLLWMNGEYLRALAPERVLEAARPFLEKEPWFARADKDRLLKAVAMEREKFKLLTDVPRRLDFFFREAGELAFDAAALAKVLRKDGVEALLEELAGVVESASPFAEAELEARIRAFCAAKGLKTGQVFHPLRVAVSGRAEGPTLFGMLELLGREECARRLRAARRLAAPV